MKLNQEYQELVIKGASATMYAGMRSQVIRYTKSDSLCIFKGGTNTVIILKTPT